MKIKNLFDMNIFLNIIWVVFGGLMIALEYALSSQVCVAPISIHKPIHDVHLDRFLTHCLHQVYFWDRSRFCFVYKALREGISTRDRWLRRDSHRLLRLSDCMLHPEVQ